VAAICIHVRAHLESLIDGEAGAELEARLRAHLADCPGCRAHHAEAVSLPTRLAALGSPEPPKALVDEVLRRVHGETLTPLHLWGPLVVEVILALVALWYVSGLNGISLLVSRTASDVGSLIGWGAGLSDLPAPAASGDVFLLLVCGLLVVTTLYHLALLARLGPRLS
jgi:predicted anti-sigma-YlaC factor YlaD